MPITFPNLASGNEFERKKAISIFSVFFNYDNTGKGIFRT